MANKWKEYEQFRNDGLDLALRIVQENGAEGLQREIKARKATGISVSMTEREMNEYALGPIKELCFDTVMVAYLSVLHDKFGFGEKRLQRAMIEFDKMTTYLAKGWIHWADVRDELKEKYGLTFDEKYFNKARLGHSYAHPEPEDIYGVDDLVDDNAWKDLLEALNFTEQANPNGKDSFDVYDEKGIPFMQYNGPFGKIQMYDVLSGVLEAKLHWGIS